MELNNERIRIGSRLRELREAQGLTTTQLGERCGLTQSTISKVENGKWSVSLDILSKVCEALGAELNINDKDMKIEDIDNVNQLARYINSCEDWELQMNEVIERNGWVDETGEDYGICNDGIFRVSFNSDMKAVVVKM